MKKIYSFLICFLLIVGIFLLNLDINLVDAAAEETFEGILYADSLVVHSDPTKNTPVTELVYGSRVNVIGINTAGTRYKIKYDGNNEGYVSKSYVINLNSSTLTTDQKGFKTYKEYCKTLVDSGFVESYCPYLYYLYVKHPNWKFIPNVVDSTLENASVREVEKVSLQTNNENYWVYENGKPLVNEYSSSGNYYYVNSDVISSFMDPRNSLFETTLFQFLNLEKNTDDINKNALAKIPGTGSYGNLANYYDEFMKASKSVGVNAIHLMARSKQEGADKNTFLGTTGTYTTTQGLTNPDGKTLDGFYNFYNIGSYVDSKNGYSSSIQRGLAYAAGYIDNSTSYNRPWNTPEKAVIGGGEWIGNQYVKRGQNTNYFQKFNVANYSSSSMFTHQYMTNAYAPTSESLTIKNAYIAGNLLETDFEFVIPVYKNMKNTPYQAVDKNNNSKLISIAFNDKIFTEFDKDVTENSYNLVTDKDNFKVGAKTEVSTSIVSGTGDYKFENGVAKVELVVTAEDGTKTTYIINVKQVALQENIKVEDIVNKMGVKVDKTTIYGISPDTVISTLVNTVSKNKGSAVVTDCNGKAKNSGSYVTGDKITIKGTSESVTYTIAVRGDINGDGVVKINDLILLQSHILQTRKLSDINYLAADVNYDGVIKINDLILVQSHILEKNNL